MGNLFYSGRSITCRFVHLSLFNAIIVFDNITTISNYRYIIFPILIIKLSIKKGTLCYTFSIHFSFLGSAQTNEKFTK